MERNIQFFKCQGETTASLRAIFRGRRLSQVDSTILFDYFNLFVKFLLYIIVELIAPINDLNNIAVDCTPR